MNNKSNQLPHIDTRLEICWIPEINGRGVYAREGIPVGTVIEVAPIIVYSKKLMEMAIWMLQAEGMPNPDFILDQYAITWKENPAIPLGWAAVYNHSDDNNCQFLAYTDTELIGVITLRDIVKGEQCCVSYGKEWFKKKGWIKKVDF